MNVETPQEQFDRVVEEAQTVFWETVAEEYGGTEFGDISPDASFQLERAMREALAEWIENNIID